jgi:hypothetical protein
LAAIGSRYDSIQNDASGAVYIYEYNGEAWILLQKLLPSTAGQNANFGYSVAIYNTTIAVGSPLHFNQGKKSMNRLINRKLKQFLIYKFQMS